MLLLWIGAGATAFVIGVWILRWMLGIKEILNRLKDIREELDAIREQKVTARSSFAAKPDVPEAELSHLDMSIPEDWRLGRADE
jgi:hypothetical protein